MSENRYGFDLLRYQLVEFVESEVEWMAQDKNEIPGASPIERLLLLALLMQTRVGMSEFTTLAICREKEQFDRIKSYIDKSPQDRATHLIVQPQVQLEGWRVDFVVSFYSYPTRYNNNYPEGWRSVIIECDGHNYHERTKEQAAKDRSRDRAAAIADMPVLRFTGSEIWRDPIGCSQQILDFALKGWG